MKTWFIWKNMRIIQNIYHLRKDQKGINLPDKNKRSIRQSGVFRPDLFKLYSERTLS